MFTNIEARNIDTLIPIQNNKGGNQGVFHDGNIYPKLYKIPSKDKKFVDFLVK